jgi:hypothetical protein
MPNQSFWSTLPGILTALAGVIAALATLVGALTSSGLIKRKPSVPAASASEPAATKPAAAAATPKITALRSAPAVLSDAQLDAMLGRLGFFDKVRNAAAAGIVHRYEPQVVGSDQVIVDRATGLMWQKGGSDRAMTADGDYVDRLNRERFAGFTDWRMPTAEEAMSLMEPQAAGDGPHIAPVFQRGINFIWTADRRPDGRGWLLYFYDGTIAAEPLTFNGWLRAVRTIAE